MGFYHSFINTVLHSLWQAALLLLLYASVNIFTGRIHPLQKRNLLYGLLAGQILLSFITFIYYCTGYSANELSWTLNTIKFTLPDLNWLYNYSEIVFYCYAVIVLQRSFALWKQTTCFKNNYKKDLIKSSAELKVFTALNAYRLGIKRTVTLRYSKYIKSPLTFGFFKPFILLPVSLINNISLREAESVILHELSHIKNRDYLLNWFLIFAEIVFFFNPFIKIIAGKIKAEREKNCDVQVIGFNYDRLLYAQTLLKIAKLSNGVKDFQLGAVRRKPELLDRIHFFSKEENPAFSTGKSFSFALLFSLLIAASALFFFPKFVKKENSVLISAFQAGSIINKEHNFSVRTKEVTGNRKFKNIVKESGTARLHSKEEKSESLNMGSLQQETSLPAIPVVFNETPDSTKEFIYKEETQQGKITQSFRLMRVNGEWLMQPQWMMLETKPDSTGKKLTDSIPALQ